MQGSMQVSNILIVLFLILLIWNSHLAGAAYVNAKGEKRIERYAKGRSVVSLVLAVVIVTVAWK